MSLAIVYGSTTSNTQNVAEQIQAQLGGELLDVSDISPKDLEGYSSLVFGSSTWGDGDLQDDWDEFDFDELKLSGKKVAVFGLGDSDGYPDSFVDAMGILAEKVKAAGGELVGEWSTDGYEFESSKAVVSGKFVGLAIDEDNQSDKTEERVKGFCALIKPLLG